MKKVEIAIIGAGIAGLSIAKRLFDVGSFKEIILIEQNSYFDLINQSHPSVILEPAFLVGNDLQKIFNQKAYFSALNFYLQLDNEIWHSKGLIKIANIKHLEKKQTQLIELMHTNHPINSEFLLLTKQESSKLAGIDINQSAIYYPNAGLLSPEIIIKTIFNQTKERISYLFNQRILKIEKKDNQWMFFNQESQPFIKAKKVIYAGGYLGLGLIREIDSNFEKKLCATRGQVSIIDENLIQFKPKVAISGSSFISTVLAANNHIKTKHIAFGSSWDRKFAQSVESNLEDHHENLKKANLLCKNLFIKTPLVDDLKASVSIRLNTQIRSPILQEFKKNFWLLTALGSRGYQYAPYLSKKLLEFI